MKPVSLLFLIIVMTVQTWAATMSVEEWNAIASSCNKESHCQVNYWTPQIQQACNNDANCVALIKAFMVAESGGNPFVVSHTGCAGLLQLCRSAVTEGAKAQAFFDQTHAEFCCPSNFKAMYNVPCGTKNNICKMHGYLDPRFDNEKNIVWATQEKILKYLRSEAVNGNLVLAAIAYNAGPATIPKIKERVGNIPITLETLNARLLEEVMLTFKGYRESTSIDVAKKAKALMEVYVPKIQRDYLYFGGKLTEGKVIIGSWTPLQESTQTTNPSTTGTSGTLTRSSTLAYGYNPGATFRGALGSYTVWPGIKLILPLKIGEFELLRAQVQSLYKDCSGVQDLDTCVQRMESISSLQWTIGMCAEDEEKFAHEITHALSSCLVSPSVDCQCEIPLSSSSSSIELVATQQENEEIGTLSLLWNSKVRETYEGNLQLETDTTPVPIYKMILEGTREGFELKTQLQESTTALPLQFFSKDQKFFSLLKKAQGLILLKAPSDKPKCDMKNRYRTFCVKSSSSYYPALTPGTQKKQMVYRFSMYFPETPVSFESSPEPQSTPSSTPPASFASTIFTRTLGWNIVIIGDSLSAAQQQVDWPFIVSRSQPMFSFTNLGINGEWVNSMSNNFTAATAGFNEVIIFGGANDLLNERPVQGITNDLLSMYQQARQAGMRVTAITVPSVHHSTKYIEPKNGESEDITRARIATATAQLNAWILSQKQAGNVDYVVDVSNVLNCGQNLCGDYYGKTNDPDIGDGLHPNRDGNRQLALAIQEQAFPTSPTGAQEQP